MSTDLRVPWGGLAARIRASVTARRLVPAGPALLATDIAYRTATRLSARRLAQAVATMDAIVGGTPAESDLTELAIRHVMVRARAAELTWRPWDLHRIPVRGLEHLSAARAARRGLVVSFTHLGPSAGWVTLGPLLAPVVLLTNDRLDDPGPSGYWDYQLRHRRKQFQDAIHKKDILRHPEHLLNPRDHWNVTRHGWFLR